MKGVNLKQLWSKYKNHFVILIALTVLIIHFGFLIKYAVNVPYWDDFDSVLLFLDNYLVIDSLPDKVSLIVSRHNEHRIILNRLIPIFQFYLFGNVNFKWLIFFGNALLALFFISLFHHHRRQYPVS